METINSNKFNNVKDYGNTLVVFLSNGNSLLLPQVKNFVDNTESLNFEFYDEKFKIFRTSIIYKNNIVGYGFCKE